MKKKFGVILALSCIGLACVAAGCSKQTELEKYQKKGYTVMVTYDANGGSFLNRQGVTVMDLFKPSDYMDENGVAHIKLIEPTDLSRPTSGAGNVTLTKQQHFFIGWYQNRELLTNEDGKVVAEDGSVLEELDGKYFYTGTETEATPAYTYSGYWDFEEDIIEYEKSDGLFQMTLYAAWVPYYQFDYYYRVEGETDWTYVSSSTFDYKTTNAEGSTTYDKDTIWVPDWQDGTMNYSYRYANQSIYEFPKISDTTFKAAYTDEECTQKIEGSFEHQGSIDYNTGRAVDRVQNVYIEVEKGERYKIETAEQFSKYANLNGIYEIMADLDFKNGEVRWPNAFCGSEFNGKIYSVNEGVYTFKNVSAKYASSGKQGGLFGKIGASAIIKDVKFENATMDFSSVSSKEKETTFGFFAGYIDEAATVTNVSVDGTLRLGSVSLDSKSDYKIHLIANGTLDGITPGLIKLVVYGQKLPQGKYQYSFAPDNVIVDETDWTITLDYSKKAADNRVDYAEKEIGTFEIQPKEV